MDNTTPNKPKLRWYQYRLRSLFVLTFLACLVMSWFGVRWARIRADRYARSKLEELGASIGGTVQEFVDTRILFFDGQWKGRNEDLALLKDITTLHGVIFDDPAITLEGLKVLKDLHSLDQLNFDRTGVSDEVLADIGRMQSLRSLNLTGRTEVTDRMVANIGQLRGLRSLSIRGPITDQGMDHLRGLSMLEELELCDTQAGDARIEQLFAELPCLKTVTYRFLRGEEIPIRRDLHRGWGTGVDLEFLQGMPLADALEFFEDIFDCYVTVDEELEGIGSKTVDYRPDRKRTFQAHFAAALAPFDLEPVVRSEDFLITSKEKAARIAPRRWRVIWRRDGETVVADRGLRVVPPHVASAAKDVE